MTSAAAPHLYPFEGHFPSSMRTRARRQLARPPALAARFRQRKAAAGTACACGAVALVVVVVDDDHFSYILPSPSPSPRPSLLPSALLLCFLGRARRLRSTARNLRGSQNIETFTLFVDWIQTSPNLPTSHARPCQHVNRKHDLQHARPVDCRPHRPPARPSHLRPHCSLGEETTCHCGGDVVPSTERARAIVALPEETFSRAGNCVLKPEIGYYETRNTRWCGRTVSSEDAG